MAQAEEEQEQEPRSSQEHGGGSYPDSVWDEYEGQYVVVQLVSPYFAVTHPGQPAQVRVEREDGSAGVDFLPMPLLVGVLSVKKDRRGDVRVMITTRDPDTEKAKAGAAVRVDLPPDMIGPISVTSPPEDQSESPIIAG